MKTEYECIIEITTVDRINFVQHTSSSLATYHHEKGIVVPGKYLMCENGELIVKGNILVTFNEKCFTLDIDRNDNCFEVIRNENYRLFDVEVNIVRLRKELPIKQSTTTKMKV